MAIRQDGSVEVTLPSIEQFSTPASIRQFLLQQWIAETPNTKYRYYVEVLDSGSRIYLERPGRLNKGCDFVVYVENEFLHKNGNDKPPSHEDMRIDLEQKKNSLTRPQWQSVLKAIKVIYVVGSFSQATSYLTNLPPTGRSFELVLKVCRWFFIEQDITYWAGDGRDKFYKEVILKV